MKRKRNPIKGTVTHVVSAGKWKRDKKPKRMTVREFFDDLENRGSFSPTCLVERWAKKIRKDMVRAKTWIGDDESQDKVLVFVAEYLRRLQDEFWRPYLRKSKHLREDFDVYVCWRHVSRECKLQDREAFNALYGKIRVWGLRTKKFRLRRMRANVVFEIETYVSVHPCTLKTKPYVRGPGEYYDYRAQKIYERTVITVRPTDLSGRFRYRYSEMSRLAWSEMFAWQSSNKEDLHP